MSENNLPLISVLLPAYNVERFVEAAVLSICNQTYHNLEIVIIDDFSTDKTYEILQRLALVDKRIKLFRNPENLKLVKTLNFGLKKISGEYVVRMDSDDISNSNRIEKLYNYLISESLDLLGSQVETIDENSCKIGNSILPKSYKSIKKTVVYDSPILHIWICKIDVYKELNGYRDFLGAEDYDFILRVLSRDYVVENLNEILYKVRIRSGNTISTVGLKQIISHNYALKLYYERLKSSSLEDSFDECYLNNLFLNTNNNQDKFLKDHKVFMKGFNLIKNRNLLGFVYVLYVFTVSKYIRQYLINRIMFKLHTN